MSNNERTFNQMLEQEQNQNNPVLRGEQEWKSLLQGKTITDGPSTESNFSKRDLPKRHRVIAPGQMVTMDYYEDRLNVHVNDDGKATHVTYG